MSTAQSQSLADAGWALVRAGNSRGAVRQFKDALAANPENTNALTGLAQSHLNLDELSQAEGPIGALLRVAPNSAAGHRLRAEMLRRRWRTGEAVKLAREAVALDPREPLGYHILALCLSAQKHHKRAIAVCAEGLAITPGSAILRAQRADNLLQVRGGLAAEPDMLAALQLAPDSAYVLRVATRVALARNDLPRARDYASAILRRNASDREAVALYLLTDPDRHRIVRGLSVFRYWCKDHGALGVAVSAGVWAVFILAGILLALGTNVAGLFLWVGVRFYLTTRHDAHAKEVQAHFAKFALSNRF